MKCDSCLHKQICKHYENIKSETYAYMNIKFNPDEDCKGYVSTTADTDICGEWIERGFGEFYCGSYECSNCGKYSLILCGRAEKDHYCSWCGAKMKY